MASDSLLSGLRHAAQALRAARQRFALVGGLAVSIRGEPRFTRDVDLVVAVAGDREMEALVFTLRGVSYEVVALVEHEARARLATVRLAIPGGLIVDLIAATCGIENEIVARATEVAIPEVGAILVARAEELAPVHRLRAREHTPDPEGI